MITTFKGREVEISSYEVGRYLDEAYVTEACYLDGAEEQLTDEELDNLSSDIAEELIQGARELNADTLYDQMKEGD